MTGTGTGRRRLTAAVALAAAAVAAGAPPVAVAAGKAERDVMKLARFTVSLSGTQTNDWAVDHTRYDGCVDGDVRTTGSGRERLTFRTRRRARVEAVGIGREAVLSAAAGIPVRGTIERQGTFTVTQLSGGESGCGGAPEGTTTPAPDCGVRRWSGRVNPILHGPGDAPVENPVLQLVDVLAFTGPDLSGGRHPGELFANCPGSDALLRATDTAELTPRQLFSRKRRIVVRGRETVKRTQDGTTETVTIAWRAVLTRRGAVRRVPGARAPR